ncbi:hypothetical protein GW17_00033443 [Ensete ventricosum]|nr:hypothetical protein GW17_00033443 [Ensete ventricosum]
MTSGDARENEVRGNRNEDAQEEEEGLGDHCVLSIELVNAHSHKVAPKALKHVANVGKGLSIHSSVVLHLAPNFLGSTSASCYLGRKEIEAKEPPQRIFSRVKGPCPMEE